MSLQVLKPKIFGTQSEKVNNTQRMTDFVRDILNESIAVDITASKRPIIDKFAPLYHVRKDAPPLILITGDRELELLGRFEENAYLERMMKVLNHKNTELFELQGFNHGGMVDPGLKILIKSIKKILGS